MKYYFVLGNLIVINANITFLADIAQGVPVLLHKNKPTIW